ncbi:PAS domain-containing protein [Psychromonas sp. KJ10-10]|uniref:PAS domain-containing protein n=1 Tax=Psychromonas sp. KJ10-10 TaxID=3391823 RepID=UPI0039B54E1E
MKFNNSTSSPDSILNDKESLFDALFNQEFEFIAILSAQGRVLKVNNLALSKQGVKREDYVGKLFWESPAWRKLPEWENIWKQRLIEASQHKKAIVTEDVFEVEGGSLHYADASTRALFGPDGEVSGYIIQAIDITKKRLREKQILEHDALIAFVLEHSKIGHWEIDLADHSAHRSLIHDQIFGYESLLPEWSYQTFLEHVVLDEREDLDRQFKQSIKNKSDWNFECRIQRKDGEIRWILASGGHVFDINGKATAIAGVVQDITAIKKAEIIKLRHNAELQSLFDALPDTYFRLKSDGTILDYHAQNQGDLYVEPKDFQGKRVQDILPKQVGDLFLSKVEELKKVKQTLDFQYKLTIKGEETYFEARLNSIAINGQLICVIRNVTAEFKSKQSLAVREQFFRSIFEQAAVGVALVNATNGEFIRVNQRYCDIVGYSENEMTKGKTFQSLTHRDDLQSDLKYFEKVRCGLQKNSPEKSVTYIRMATSFGSRLVLRLPGRLEGNRIL